MKRLLTGLIAAVIGCGGGGGGTEPSPEPPVIVNGPVVEDITTTSAVVQWTTDRPCDSKVRFGRSGYEDSVFVGELVENHQVVLADLEPLTLYHYNVSSADADGLTVTSDDRSFTTLSPVGDLVELGWDHFEQGDFDSALATFEMALGYDSHSVDALEGCGWSKLRLYDFTGSRSSFEEALNLDDTRVDCLVGLSFTALALESYQEALDLALTALNLGGENYIFSHDASITGFDLRYCRILAFVGLGDFESALEEVRIVEPSTDLDPQDPSTWNGYDTFEEALLALIEDLADSTLRASTLTGCICLTLPPKTW